MLRESDSPEELIAQRGARRGALVAQIDHRLRTVDLMIAPESVVVYRSSSLINQLVAAKGGIGLGVLPCYLADPEPGLRRVLPPIPELTRELWLITHNDLRRTARVRAFMELIGEGILRQRPALEGSTEAPAPRRDAKPKRVA